MTANAEGGRSIPDVASPFILVRATVHLTGLSLGHEAHVDPRDPYISQLLASRYLVPVEP